MIGRIILFLLPNMQKDTDSLRMELLNKILTCISGKTPHTELMQFAETLTNKPEIHTDIPLLQSVTILDFLAKQIGNGNTDVLTRDIVEESYVYIMNKLTPTVSTIK